MAISIDCEQVRISAMAAADGEERPVSSEQISEHLRGVPTGSRTIVFEVAASFDNPPS
jgi:predicted anti-sigma-YlaC factor YlaD